MKQTHPQPKSPSQAANSHLPPTFHAPRSNGIDDTLFLALMLNSKLALKITPRAKGFKETKRQGQQTNAARDIIRLANHLIKSSFQDPRNPQTTLGRDGFDSVQPLRKQTIKEGQSKTTMLVVHQVVNVTSYYEQGTCRF